jgi:hypothetical protein
MKILRTFDKYSVVESNLPQNQMAARHNLLFLPPLIAIPKIGAINQ